MQVFGRSSGEYTRLSRQNESMNRSLYRVAELRGRLRGITAAAALLSIVAVLFVGLVEVRNGTASVGLVVAALVMTRLLVTPVRTLGLAHDYWHRSQISAGEGGGLPAQLLPPARPAGPGAAAGAQGWDRVPGASPWPGRWPV